MEFLVEFEVEVPAGTSHEEVDRRERAESDAEAGLSLSDPFRNRVALREASGIRRSADRSRLDA